MKQRTSSRRTQAVRWAAAAVCAVLCLALAACAGPAPSVTPVSSGPQESAAPPTAGPTAGPSPSPILPPVTSPSPIPTPTAGSAEVTVISDRAVWDFPNSISFMLEASSALPAESVRLEYGTFKRSFVDEVSRVEPDFSPGSSIMASYTWQMKKTGSIPPGAEVWWRWRITDEAGRKCTTDRSIMTFDDTRYLWRVETTTAADICWHSLGADSAVELAAGIEEGLARLELDVETPEERKPRVFVYADVSEMQGAVLFLESWAGALAFTDYNTVLIPIRPDNLDRGTRALVHEIAHLLIREYTFGPFGDMPTWLNEGLATIAGGEIEAGMQLALDLAIARDELLSVRSLASRFPADPMQAQLAYAQSQSIVTYLIDEHGWATMRDLLTAFKEGSTYDGALKQVYSFDQDGLDDLWRAHIGADQ